MNRKAGKKQGRTLYSTLLFEKMEEVQRACVW